MRQTAATFLAISIRKLMASQLGDPGPGAGSPFFVSGSAYVAARRVRCKLDRDSRPLFAVC